MVRHLGGASCWSQVRLGWVKIPHFYPFGVAMKQRRPSFENPFYSKGSKYNHESSKAMGPEFVKTPRRFCKMEKKGQVCGKLLSPERYFHCRDCEPVIPSDQGFDTNY